MSTVVWYNVSMGIEQKGGRVVRGSERSPEIENFMEEDFKRIDAETKEKEPELYEFFSSCIEDVDFDILYSIFEKYLERSRVSTELLNRIPRSRFYIVQEGENSPNAVYNSTYNHVAFNIDKAGDIKKVLLEGGDPEWLASVRLSILEILVHELVHASGNVRSHWEDIDTPEGEKRSVNTGNTGYRESNRTFEALNEGITERIAHEIFLEYSSSVGISRNKAGEEVIHQSDSRFVRKYAVFMAMVQDITDRIDEVAGLTSGTAWRALKRGAFEGSPMRDDMVQKLFNEVFDREFLERYAAIPVDASSQELGEFGSAYDLNAVRPEVINKWLEYLDIEKRITEEEES